MVKKLVKKDMVENTDKGKYSRNTIKENNSKDKKKIDKKTSGKKMTSKEREELLIENFVGLQHAMTNMSIKFGGLADNISKLLQIFEESAKNFVSGGKSDDVEMLTKIDSLLNQNKTIAKGLVLMEGKLRGRSESSSAPPRMGIPEQPPRTRAPEQPLMRSSISNSPNPKPLPTL